MDGKKTVGEFFTDLKNNMTKKKVIKIILTTLLVIVILVINLAVYSVCAILGKINYVKDGTEQIPENLDSIVLDAEVDEIESGTDIIDDSQMSEIEAEIQGSLVDENNLRYRKGVKNILVLGVDSRSKSLKSRSDVVMIATINENTKKIVLTSIMRDVYVAIPGRTKSDKINAACAYGGPSLTVKTVEQAFGIKIDDFVVFNFYSFMDIVDALGGVTVEINSGEKKWINEYVEEINEKMGLSADNGKLNKTGDAVKLTGKQAMGYVRVRYVGHGDYERTERQREVMEQMISKALKSDYGTLMEIMESVASNMSTDLTSTEILMLGTNIAKYAGYSIEQLRIPVDNTYKGGNYKGQWVLRIDMEKNKEEMYSAIFG